MRKVMARWRRTALRWARLPAALVLAMTLLPGGLQFPATAEAASYTINTDLNVMVSVTGAQLDAAIRAIRSDSGLIGLGNTFVRVGKQYSINPVYLAAHAAWESSWGNSTIARDKNNLYGWTAYDSCPYACATTFASKTDSVETVVPVIKRNYLTPGGRYYTSHGPTLRGMNVHYATDQNWKNGIASVMNMLAGRIDDTGGVTPSPDPDPDPDPDPAPPANTCTGTDCNGKNPAELVCGENARTVSSQDVTFGSGTSATALRVEVRWSETCRTNWARVQVVSAPSGAPAMNLAVGLLNTAGHALSGTAAVGSGTNIFGNMWYAPEQQVKACVSVSGRFEASVCTKPN